MLVQILKMFVLAQILLSVLCLCSSEREGWPGYHYDSNLHGWLKLHREPLDWRAARISCHMEGAFLASAWTTKFASYMYDQLSSIQQESTEDTVAALYSGFHIVSAEGAYSYIQGKPAISLELSGLAALERCVAFFASGTTGEVSCDRPLPYVCYAPALAPTPTHPTNPDPTTPAPTTPAPITPTPTTPAPTTPAPTKPASKLASTGTYQNEGYEYEARTDEWYKFHTEGLTWSNANRTCVAEGAHLAIINSDLEARVLNELHLKYKNKIHADLKYKVAVGFYKDPLGVWITVDGQTLDQAGYARWYKNMPFDYSWARYGFIMSSDGRLLSFSDLDTNAFICEK